ncbi:UMF1 family MFS transporter [Aliiruegeria haliotis]|uniref:UMF1 family MFS transporter n=1 Tax=Aliiruegeria haliotis TaxID=1280846 RepID=A0A2T0RJB8_9RHOB|nr:MFS transporter [Aliiruegeria haliotis]PRY21210.1 UMF1 family MFS transporter [Aliiruegeria haliotis]
MTSAAHRKRIWGWFFFDWASQPYNTLLLTFIFAPYIKELFSDGAAAQAAWGYTVGAAGVVIALLAPFLGAMADKGGHRIAWIRVFSVLYVLGAGGVWLADPGGFDLTLVLVLFAMGIVGMEFATIFTNSMLPDLGGPDEIGGISGSGWAFGYVGGLVALVIMLFFFAESAEGTTLLGLTPALGLDPDAREGTRFVGPFTALWYIVFMVPFFLWVKEPRGHAGEPLLNAVRDAWPELRGTLKSLPRTPSLFAFLASSMFYRDALNGLYVFGGLYAAGVLGWGVIDTGIFGIIAVVSAALFAWIGGKADNRFGPKPVILFCVLVLTAICCAVIFVSRSSVLGIPVQPDSSLPDLTFYVMGAAIGAAGGALQSASRTMMCRQSDPERTTQAFGLYALAGKATSFLAPLSIGLVTDLTNSQQAGIAPLILLFLLGIVLLNWVKPERERAVCPSPERSSPPA